MDPSYNNGFGSFGNGDAQQPASPTPSGGVGMQPQQPVVGGGNMQAPISSGEGDIVLQDKPKNDGKKRALIVLIVILILGAVGFGVGAVLKNNNVFGGVSEESYNKSLDNLSDLSLTVQSVIVDLEDCLDGKWGIAEFFNTSTRDRFNGYLEKMDSFDATISELRKIRFADDIKGEIDELKVSLEKYVSVSEPILKKLVTIIDAFVDSDSEKIEEFTKENKISFIIESDLLKYAEKYASVKPVLEECQKDNQECKYYLIEEYENEIEGDTNTIPMLFGAVLDMEDIDAMEEIRVEINEVKDKIWYKYKDDFSDESENE